MTRPACGLVLDGPVNTAAIDRIQGPLTGASLTALTRAMARHPRAVLVIRSARDPMDEVRAQADQQRGVVARHRLLDGGELVEYADGGIHVSQARTLARITDELRRDIQEAFQVQHLERCRPR